MNLSEEQLRAIWHEEIRPEVFRSAQPVDRPSTVLLGGQPGAGKSRAGEMAAAESGGSLVPIVGDDLRQFHPDYHRVMREEPLRMPEVTAAVSGRWIQMCVDHAREQGFSALIEGTWRNAQVPLEGARAAKADGRRVDAVLVAVQPEVSRLGTMERYYRDVLAGRDARWTPPAGHDAAVSSLPGTVEAVALSGDVDSLRVVSRAGETLIHDDGPPSPERAAGAVAAMQREWMRPLIPQERARYERDVHEMLAAHERLTSHSPEARAAWTQIMTHDLPLTSGRAAVAVASQARGRSVVDGVRAQPSDPEVAPHAAPRTERGQDQERGR